MLNLDSPLSVFASYPTKDADPREVLSTVLAAVEPGAGSLARVVAGTNEWNAQWNLSVRHVLQTVRSRSDILQAITVELDTSVEDTEALLDRLVAEMQAAGETVVHISDPVEDNCTWLTLDLDEDVTRWLRTESLVRGVPINRIISEALQVMIERYERGELRPRSQVHLESASDQDSITNPSA